MEKSCQSFVSSSSNSSNNNRDHYLKHLNKISHKISKDPPKPLIRRIPPLDHHLSHHHHQHQQQQHQQQQQQQQNQPPVYNINKSDFRDVVQKLTGSPAHDRFSTPPPIHPPKPPSSRLQRIRPPPLEHVSPRPPHPLNNTVAPMAATSASLPSINPNPSINSGNFNNVGNFIATNNGQPPSPLSPLPPFPAVHAAAESPISAYMRYLQGSISATDPESKRFSGLSPLAPLVSPRWNNPSPLQLQQPQLPLPPPLPQQQQVLLQSPTSAMTPSQFLMPLSPLPFGRLPSPRSPYPLLSPTFLFSPTAGQLGFPQFPPSPRLPVPSPKWRDF
ncbi:PREDICTED: VQ motif-containing protein 9 [Nelumbo nucifera]|uniref:VQ motif-containing protein 9 n=1 Tax=Nelumbo nucifera TaxID=4432 RepID=A0A1U8AXK9_NELNU|nr:PREDICTED: VQ motif-containing protein 9 [Nelumbo nucifera]